MPKLVKVCRNNYTTTSNVMWRDPELGATERGVLGTMLSLPPDWNFSIKGLAKLFPDGERKIGTSLQKIEKAGYLKRERIHSKDGKFADWQYLYSDEPIFRDNATSDMPNSQKDTSKSVDVECLAAAHDVENDVENFSKEPHRQNSNVVDMSENLSPHCQNADVDNAHLENSNANKIYNNKINNKYIYHQSYQVSSRDNNCTNVENSANVINEMDFDKAIEEVKEQISANSLYHDNQSQSGVIDELIEIIATAYTTERSYWKIGGNNLDIALVRKRLKSLDSGHIEYVLECITNSTTAIRNRRSYLLTCLYFAPVTIDGYYTNQVAHDFAGGV